MECARERARKVPADVKKERFAAYYEKNAEQLRAKRVANYAENQDKARAYAAKYRAENRDKTLLAQKKWRDENPNYKNEYRAVNLERCRSHFRNRFAKQKASVGTHTADDILAIYTLQGGMCAHCDAPVTADGETPYHVDHVMPLAKGGGNGPENLQILCKSCNLKKGSKHPDEWARLTGRKA